MHLFNLHLWGSDDLAHAIDHQDWDRVRAECEINPNKARVWHLQKQGSSRSHILPLHQAIAAHDAPPQVIHALIRAYPGAVLSKETSCRRLPLHLACQNYTPETKGQTIRLLLSYAPEAAEERDSLGRLPIHYACSNGAGVMTIDALLTTYCQGAKTQEKNGWLPIHVACKNGASFLVVQRLLDAYPESIYCRTLKGSTPLDLIENVDCRWKKEIIRMLQWDEREHIIPTERCKNVTWAESWRSDLTAT